jgi:signal transduction histidine kinase
LPISTLDSAARRDRSTDSALGLDGSSSVLKKLYIAPSLLASDLASFRRQESIFIAINLVLLGVLLAMHITLDSFWGPPSHLLAGIVVGSLFLRSIELVWVQRLSRPLSPRVLAAMIWSSILFNLVLSTTLSILTNHDDSPYYVLMVVPILEAAFRSNVAAVGGIILTTAFLNFYWVWYYFRAHPPLDAAEYLEAGISSLVFAIVGFLTWTIVNHLREKELHLANNVLELQRAREKLLQEETLAAVGRLSSAIAHEIRNPVAMISSSLATALNGGLEASEREEMFSIAAREATRLEKLTGEFLSYARPKPPQLATGSVADILHYVASICRAHAGNKGIHLEVDAHDSLRGQFDSGQIQQAVLNLVMNAVDASPEGGVVLLHATRDGGDEVRITVANQGKRISSQMLPMIFEPFFTSKPQGTGLGLAIARNIARGHSGDLVVEENSDQNVRFALILPASASNARPKN